jgi:hypothetical protein
MKNGVKWIVGKTICGLVVAERASSPGHQVFLIFEDDTHFEFWGDSFTCAGGIDSGGIGRVQEYVTSCGSRISMIDQAASRIGPGIKKPNHFPRFCVVVVFLESLVGSLALFLDHDSAGGVILAVILAGFVWYIFCYQIERFNEEQH